MHDNHDTGPTADDWIWTAIIVLLSVLFIATIVAGTEL